MEKLDLKKIYGDLYSASAKQPSIVTVAPLTYLTCDGHGDPNNSVLFQQAVEALYTLSYTLKFMVKKGDMHIDYGVMPLEGLWWTDDINYFSMDNKAIWKWKLMILQPDFITDNMFAEAAATAAKKKAYPLIKAVKRETMEEGLCAQILHIGPYSTEPPTVAKLHEFIKENGYRLTGKHREIYMNDMRRTAPERLKTIIRQPIIS